MLKDFDKLFSFELINLIMHRKRNGTKILAHGIKFDECHAISEKSKMWNYEQNRKCELRGEMFNKIYHLLEGNVDIHDNRVVEAIRKLIKTRDSHLLEFGIQIRKRVLYLVKCNEKSPPKGVVETKSFLRDVHDML